MRTWPFVHISVSGGFASLVKPRDLQISSAVDEAGRNAATGWPFIVTGLISWIFCFDKSVSSDSADAATENRILKIARNFINLPPN
jgi:hypothetical protein